jgi:hypothetical protein
MPYCRFGAMLDRVTGWPPIGCAPTLNMGDPRRQRGGDQDAYPVRSVGRKTADFHECAAQEAPGLTHQRPLAALDRVFDDD